MVANIEKIEKNIATIKIEVSPQDFNKAVNQSYNKNKGKFNIAGFRKGKAPRNIIERHYGTNVFYEDAIDFAFPDAYSEAIKEHSLTPVARPAMEEIDKIDSKEGFVFTISVALKPEVELGEYKETEISKLTYEVNDDDINKDIEDMRDKNSRLVSVDDAEAKIMDTVIIDFEGFLDGNPFEGGKADNYSLVLGSKTFIPGFEEQLEGVKKGEEKDVNVTFPEDYQSEELAGKQVVFKVKVNEIKVKELPELDDEFVKDVSEFDTLDELKNDLKGKIHERKLNELKDAATNKVIETAVENASMEIPEPMVEEDIQRVLGDFEYRLKMQGMSLEDYFKYTNMEKETLMEEIREDVIKRIKRDLVLNKITEVENIEAPEADIEEEIEKHASMYKMEVEKLKETLENQDNNYFENTVKRNKTIEFLIDNAKQI